MRLYIASGVTSNLFTALLPVLTSANHLILANTRQTSDPIKIQALKDSGVKFVNDDIVGSECDRILWLSTHDDPERLAKLAQQAPTLVISSASIMDFIRGVMTEDQLNGYQKSKLSMLRAPGVYAFVPGFFIEDVKTPDWASKGLHGDTTSKVFGPAPVTDDPNFDWGKGYSVTPKSFITAAISAWLSNSNAIQKNEPIIVCSDRIYRRFELRELSGLDAARFGKGLDANRDSTAIYSEFPHFPGFTVTDEDVIRACVKAANFN